MASLLVVIVLLMLSGNGKINGEIDGNSSKTKWRFYLEESGQRMVLTTEKNGTLRDCFAFGDEYLINEALKSAPPAKVIKLDKKTMNSLANYCTSAKYNSVLSGTNGEEIFVRFGVFSGMLIYPGTKWCGAGNISESYDDLGPEVEADRCCRDHDHCNDSIEGFGSKYEVDNNGPFTKSHCDCDDEFHNCLREANTKASNRIGKLFFNYIQMECFRLAHPIIGCNRYKGFFRPRCQEYVLDPEQEPLWQMFDAKHFEPKGDEDDNEIDDRYNDVFEYMIHFNEHSKASNLKIKSTAEAPVP